MRPGPQTTRQGRSCPHDSPEGNLVPTAPAGSTLPPPRPRRGGAGGAQGSTAVPGDPAWLLAKVPRPHIWERATRLPKARDPADQLRLTSGRCRHGTPKVLGGLKGELSSHLPRVAPSLPIQRDAAGGGGETGLMTKARRRLTGGEEGVDRLGDHRRRGSGGLLQPARTIQISHPPHPLRLSS